MIRCAGPTVILRHSAAQREYPKRLLAFLAQRAQALRNFTNDGFRITGNQRSQQLAPPLGDLIDNDAAIHHHRDASGTPAPCRVLAGIQGEREEGDVDAGRLAGPSRKVKHTRPLLLGNDLTQ
ncbi:MAG: hypothetical protein ACREV9_03630 [Burkholderiales bacterium]